jgi:uracil-DNA glycosylase
MSTSDGDELASLVISLRRHLQRQRRMGIRFLAQPEVAAMTPATIRSEKPVADKAQQRVSGNPDASNVNSLEELRDDIGDCRRCKLHSGRTHLVFGIGNPTAKLMFIGEGPGRDEDLKGEPFLKKQIELIRPEIIVALGKFAVQTLLQSKVPITRLRGNWHTYMNIKLMPTFHPAYLLRNPADKKLVWEDIKKVMKEMQSENA